MSFIDDNDKYQKVLAAIKL